MTAWKQGRAQGAVLIAFLGYALAVQAQDGEQKFSLPENPHALDANRACGTYCLTFLNTYFGGDDTYEEIAQICPPGPLGTSLLEIKSAAQRLGLHAEGVRLTLGELEQLHMTAVLHLERTDDIDHFIVWLGSDSRTGAPYVFNPPNWLGHQRRDVLEKDFSGVALLVSADPLPDNMRVIAESRIDLLYWIAGLALVVSSFSIARSLFTLRRISQTVALMLALGSPFVLGGCVDAGASDIASRDERRNVDLGILGRDEVVKHTFTIRNTTDSEFKIINIEKSCTCQTINTDVGRILMPGEMIPIALKTSTGRARGAWSARVIVHTDSKEPAFQQITLALRGKVQDDLRANPSQLVFGTVRPAETSVKELRVESTISGLLEKYERFDLRTDNFEVTLSEQRQGALIFLVSVSPNAPEDDLHDRLSLYFNDKSHPLLSVDVRARKVGQLAVIPRAIRLSPFVRDERQTFRMRIYSTNTDSFRITNVESDEHIEVRWSSLETATAFDLTVEVARPPDEFDQASIVIHTDSSEPVRCIVQRAHIPDGLKSH